MFRFHDHFDVCENRLRMIKKLNPDVKIFGLYGGAAKSLQKAKDLLSGYFDNVYEIKGKTSEWKWRHGDLAIREWFVDFGHQLKFDYVAVLEWDLVMFESLDKTYGHIKSGCVGITGLIETKDVDIRWKWLYQEPHKSEWKELTKLVQEKYGYDDKLYASQGPGSYLPYKFLKKYAAVTAPATCNDELRLPLYIKALGFDICDTNFFRKWFDDEEPKYFNCWGAEIKLETISNELRKKEGRRVFHPYCEILDLGMFQ